MRLRDLLKLTDFVTVPAAIVGLVCLCRDDWPPNLALIAAGVLAWTFAEYWSHRLLHVGRLRAFHWRHHQHPRELTGGTLYSTLAILALMLAATRWPTAAPFILGFLSGYFAFLFLHNAFHTFDLAPDLWPHLQINHAAHHHDQPERCFGVTTGTWDKLFRTDRIP